MAENNNGMMKGLVIGLLAGTAIGSVIALLYAPKSGRELRGDLKEKADEFVGDAEAFTKSAREKSGQLISDARRRSEELIADAKVKANSLLSDADNAMKGAREKAGAMIDEGSRVKSAVKAGVEAFKEERNRS
jgi:gas vesicle protein